MTLLMQKLQECPCGTNVEMTVGLADGLKKMTGVVVKNDLASILEIVTCDGNRECIEYAQVKRVKKSKTLENILRSLAVGTKIRFATIAEDDDEPCESGTICANDGTCSLEIVDDDGEEETLEYSFIRSLIIVTQADTVDEEKVPAPEKESDSVKEPEPVEEPESVDEGKNEEKDCVVEVREGKRTISEWSPSDWMNVSDGELRNMFRDLPREDSRKLNSCYERFQYGVKMTNRSKMEDAGRQAGLTLLMEDEQGHQWSREAVIFCASLMRRSSLYDHRVLCVGRCLEEAAYAAWKEGRHDLAGAYAIAALVAGAEHVGDLTIILACSVVNGEDISGLRVLSKYLSSSLEELFWKVTEEGFLARGLQVPEERDAAAALELLAPHYPNTGMGEEAERWIPEDLPLQPESAAQPEPEPEPEPDPETFYGTIARLHWVNCTGVIAGENGNDYSFRYQDIVDPQLAGVISECKMGDLGGRIYVVKFFADKDTARSIQLDNSLVDRARAIVADPFREDRFQVAYDLCRYAIDTTDVRRALADLIKYAIKLYTVDQQTPCIKEALTFYEKHSTMYPSTAFAVIDIAMCYSYLKKYPQMMEHAEKAVSFPGLTVKQRISVLANYLKMTREYYDVSGDKSLLARMLERIDELKNSYSQDFEKDHSVKKQYAVMMLPYRIVAECGMDMLKKAEVDYAMIPPNHTYKETLAAILAKTRDRLAAQEKPADVSEENASAAGESQDAAVEEERIEDYDDDPEEEEEDEAEPAPYVDTNGWDALNLSKKDVVNYALQITGPERIPAILAYLRAGSNLNPEIKPVYDMIALAANDPMASPDYNITNLENAHTDCDPGYQVLNDCCLAAAFLRTSFLSGRGFDYSAQSLREDISVICTVPALQDAYDILETFRKEAGQAMDIYAAYRNQDVMELQERLHTVMALAKSCNNRFVTTPARERVKFARLLETKKILFAKDGYLAVMLQNILENNQQAMEAEKANFTAAYLNGSGRFASRFVNSNAVDALISHCWDEAGRGMTMKKVNETLQGNGRSNLRSIIREILDVIRQWYDIAEQSAGVTWRTQEGEEAYQRLRPQLMEQLDRIGEECRAELEAGSDPELSTGLTLLAGAARELTARMDGSWNCNQDKYMYADFLRSSNILLDENFMPDLSATFCVLPGFNILARIRRHVEESKLTFQERIDQIYGRDKTCNNYGAAKQIVAYLEAAGQGEAVTLPPNADEYIAHTQMQIDMRYRSFREIYAFASNAGQIIISDDFCRTLEDTVRYWYFVCKKTQNYGFFTSLLNQAEAQIHASARQYEVQLEEQLDALVASNRQYFDEHPGHEDAIREQIAGQRFIVVEDWMRRIRTGGISVEVQQPEAITYLEDFWSNFVKNHGRVHNGSSSLSAQYYRDRSAKVSKDAKGARQLIDSWLNNGSPSTPQRIEQLLNLLGWRNIYVTSYQFDADPLAEIYEVNKGASAAALTTPLHPIAPFGSDLEKKRMYVACLYGSYDCDRLYAKMRALDVIDGSKIILLDHAMGQVDRRGLARKLKRRESTLRNVNLVIDRVLIAHLADVYNKDLINRILMATAMPFTYCQPYVVESAHTMPPEIFIGRREELMEIESPNGVNLIYGGRQLGKSALFKKALADLDGRQKQRAVLVDINGKDCASAARFLSQELIALKITPDAEVTDDWGVLCQNIKQRLRSEEDEISYFLLMLDEADAFIKDCANVNYTPLVALKDIQQSLPGRFKYVLAGLHDIIRFNHQVALGNNSVITHMPSLKITPFRTPEAEELLIEPLSYLGFSLPSKVTITQIVATCNYFPGLIQLYAKKLIESIRTQDYAGYDPRKTPPYIVSDEHLRRVMANREFVEQIHNKFHITLTLDQDQGSCYLPLTLLIAWMYNAVNSKSGYTARDVLHYAKDLNIHALADLDVEKISALMMELQDLNILRGVSNDSYLLASKNFRDLLGTDDEISEKLEKLAGGSK